MQPDTHYHETVNNPWGIAGLVVLSAAILLLAVGAFQSGVNYLFVTMFALALLVGLFLLNFLVLRINASDSGIKVSFGLFRRRVSWKDIAGCEVDPSSPFTLFGIYGTRITVRRGQPMQAFAVSGEKVFILRLKEGWYKYFAFSTRHPDELKALVEPRIR
jgi:hypothetical protein